MDFDSDLSWQANIARSPSHQTQTLQKGRTKMGHNEEYIACRAPPAFRFRTFKSCMIMKEKKKKITFNIYLQEVDAFRVREGQSCIHSDERGIRCHFSFTAQAQLPILVALVDAATVEGAAL